MGAVQTKGLFGWLWGYQTHMHFAFLIDHCIIWELRRLKERFFVEQKLIFDNLWATYLHSSLPPFPLPLAFSLLLHLSVGYCMAQMVSHTECHRLQKYTVTCNNDRHINFDMQFYIYFLLIMWNTNNKHLLPRNEIYFIPHIYIEKRAKLYQPST